jgi:uridine phosphorylase
MLRIWLSRFGFRRRTLSRRGAGLLAAERLLDRSQACLERLELLGELVAGKLASLGELRPGLLPAPRHLPAGLPAPPRHLVACLEAAAGDLIEKVRRALARLGTGGRLERARNCRAQGVGDASVAAFLRPSWPFATHDGQHNPPPVTVHLRPTAPIAADALLPGDPGRALALAQALLERPRMANHARGIWGYSGRTPAGHELTIQSTGIGGPSGAVVLEELADLGVRRAVRVGTCTSLDGGLRLGDILLVDAAISDDGTSRALGANPASRPEPALQTQLQRDGTAKGAVVASTDLFYDPASHDRRAGWLEAGASAVELGSAALFEVGRRRGIAVASCLVVAELADGARLDDEALDAAGVRAGRLASEALGG